MTTRTATGFEPYASWTDVLSAANSDKFSLWYWGAMDTRPHRVKVMRVFKNGKIRVDPMTIGVSVFTLDPGHLNAGLVYGLLGRR